MRIGQRFVILFMAMVLLVGCSVTKYVPDGEYLLNSVSLKMDTACEAVKEADLMEYVKQMPNSPGVFLNKTSLRVYSMSGQDTSKWINRAIRKVGEEPVIYSEAATRRSRQEIKSELMNYGYFNAEVESEVKTKEKKAEVKYKVMMGKPYTVRNYTEHIGDPMLDAVMNTTKMFQETRLKEGDVYNASILDQHLDKVVRFARNQGYYDFTKENLVYSVDTALGTHQVDISLGFRPTMENDTAKGDTVNPSLMRYTVKNVNVVCLHNSPTMSKTSMMQTRRQGDTDTTTYRGINFVSDKKKPFLCSATLFRNNFIRPHRYYSEDLHERTYAGMSHLGAVKQVNISYQKDTARGMINATVTASPAKVHYWQFGLDGTNTAGDLGVESYLTYQNKNIFKGSEALRIKIGGAYEFVQSASDFGIDNQNFYEISPQISLSFPRFLCPGLSDTYIGRTGKTTFSMGYTWQNRPEFYKRYLTFDWKYSWATKRNKHHHALDLYNITYTRVPWILPEFKEKYLDVSKNILLKQNYTDQFITRTSYTYSCSDIQVGVDRRAGQTFSMLLDMSGTLPYLVSRWSNAEQNGEGKYLAFGVPFSQYARIDLDYSRMFRLTNRHIFAWHVGVGVASPYGNSEQIPYERRYFGGGPNSLRGWSTRTLGPGKYKSAGGSDFFNQTGDIKLILQAEYRFKASEMIEYAMFLDAGNVWTIKEYENQPNGAFAFNTFAEEIALSYGIGLRLDLSFILVRFDFGMKAHDPSEEEPWVITHHSMKRDFAWHFAIGYPF